MKRTILAVLMALVFATPCLAQEVELDGFFSIEGTRWRTCGVSASLQLGWDGGGSEFNFNIGCSGNSYGFYGEKVYSCIEGVLCFPEENSFYIDTPLVSIAYIGKPFPSPYVYLLCSQLDSVCTQDLQVLLKGGPPFSLKVLPILAGG